MKSFLLILPILLGIAAGNLPNFRVTKTELKNFVNQLRAADSNKARPSQIRLNYGDHVDSSSFYDRAPRNLFSSVNTAVLRRPTFEKFKALLNNYNKNTGQREMSSQEEAREIDAFLDAILETRVMSKLYNFFHTKRHSFATNARHWRTKLKSLWFGGYSRARGVTDTSGFEHVFVGEVKNRQVKGLHNWYRFYLLEKSGEVDYKGFLVKRNGLILGGRYEWRRDGKLSGSFFIGTSPEFDFALYTLCFLTHRGKNNQCEFEIDHCKMAVVSYPTTQNGRDYIGTIYPRAGRITNDCRRSTSSRGRN